jgi:PadR family transcriptional regulator PadR
MKAYAQTIVKALAPQIILKELSTRDMHGYGLINYIRHAYGVYLGPSTIYPLLADMEKAGLITSDWNMNGEKPRKPYRLTNKGRLELKEDEIMFSLIARKESLQLVRQDAHPA